MAIGPGKYDNLATIVRERSGAQAVIVAVFNGDKGSGFSVQVQPTVDLGPLRIAEVLRAIADEIDKASS